VSRLTVGNRTDLAYRFDFARGRVCFRCICAPWGGRRWARVEWGRPPAPAPSPARIARVPARALGRGGPRATGIGGFRARLRAARLAAVASASSSARQRRKARCPCREPWPGSSRGAGSVRRQIVAFIRALVAASPFDPRVCSRAMQLAAVAVAPVAAGAVRICGRADGRARPRFEPGARVELSFGRCACISRAKASEIAFEPSTE